MMSIKSVTGMLLAAIIMLATSCAADRTAGGAQLPEGVIALKALRIGVENGTTSTRTTSDGNTWTVGDCVYIRNATGTYAKDQVFRKYIYRANGLFTPESDDPDSVINFTGASDLLEAYYRGDDQQGTHNRPLDYPFTVTEDQSTAEKLQTADFLYTKQTVVYLQNPSDETSPNIGAVNITLHHKVSQILVNVTLNEGQTLDHIYLNSGSEKLYKVATPTLADGNELDLVGTAYYDSNTESTVSNISMQQYADYGGGNYLFKAFVIPQVVNDPDQQAHLIDVVTKDAEDNLYHYYYDMRNNTTFVKGKSYTYTLSLVESNYHNIFKKHLDGDPIDNRDLGKVLCSDGSLVPTVTEAKAKGYTPLGILVQFAQEGDGYTGLCMSYEDINTTPETTNAEMAAAAALASTTANATTLSVAFTNVINYKKLQGKPNPGALDWCSDWFIPTKAQWESVMTWKQIGQGANPVFDGTGVGASGAYQVNKNRADMLAYVTNDQGQAYDIAEEARVALGNHDYWTSSATNMDNVTKMTVSASSGSEGTKNVTNAEKANCRAFFKFTSNSTTASKNAVKTVIDTYLLSSTTVADIGKLVLRGSDGKGYVPRSNVSADDVTYLTLKNMTPVGMIVSVGSPIALIADGQQGANKTVIAPATGETVRSGLTQGLAISLQDLGAYQIAETNHDMSDTYVGDGIVTNPSSKNYGAFERNRDFCTVEKDGKNIYGDTPDRYPVATYPLSNRATFAVAFYQCWNKTPYPSNASHWFLPGDNTWRIAYDAVAEKMGQGFRVYTDAGTTNAWVGNKKGSFEVIKYFDTMISSVGGTPLQDGIAYWTSTDWSQYNGSYIKKNASNASETFGLFQSANRNEKNMVRPFFVF